LIIFSQTRAKLAINLAKTNEVLRAFSGLNLDDEEARTAHLIKLEEAKQHFAGVEACLSKQIAAAPPSPFSSDEEVDLKEFKHGASLPSGKKVIIKRPHTHNLDYFLPR